MALINRRQRFNLTNPQYLLAQALQKGIPTGPARGGWTEGLSRIGQAFIGKQAMDEANTEFKADEINRQATLQQAIRAGRGFTNPDDTFVQLAGPIQKDADGGFLPISEQPGAEAMYTPRAPSLTPNVLGQKIPSVAGSRQAMAEVLMGSGRDDLMDMGIKMDPRFRDPLSSRPSATIQDFNFLQNLNRRYPLTAEDKRLGNVYSKEAMAFMGLKRGSRQQDLGDRIVTVDPLNPTQILRTDMKKLSPAEQPKHKGAVITAEGEARTEVALAKALPTRIQSIEGKLINLPFLDRNLQRVKELAASPTTSGKMGLLTGLDPSSDQFSLNEAVVQFQSLIGLDSLVRLKEKGATMGALNKEEMGLLVNKVGSLNTLADPSMLSETLDTIMFLYKKGIRGDQDKFGREYPGAKPTWKPLNVPNPIHQNAIREGKAAIRFQSDQGQDVRDEVIRRLKEKYPDIDLTGF